MKLELALFLILLGLNFVHAGDRKCRALALSGGGDLGAYEAGAFIELVNLLPTEDVAYDVVTGVSAGSMNSAGLGLFGPYEGQQASEFLFALWNSISIGDVLEVWPQGIFAGLYEEGGLVSTQPLKDFVTEQTVGMTVKRKISFATTDMDNANYEVYDFEPSETIPDDYIISAIASSSIPGIFPPIYKDGKNLADGGGLWNLDIPGAVRRCREVVDDEADIIIDIVICAGSGNDFGPKVDVSNYSALSHYRRAKEIGTFYEGINKVESALVLYPDVQFRYLLTPSEKLLQPDNPIPLIFGTKHTDRCFKVAEKDARNAVKMGPGASWEVFREFGQRIKQGEDVNYEDMIQTRISGNKSE
jgi:hypothetical protein